MPPDRPVTAPVVAFTVTMLVALLLHVPPLTVLVFVIVCPAHTVLGPPNVPGELFTVTTLVTVLPPRV